MFEFVLLLIVVALIGWIADLVVPGHLPFGWVGSIVVGLAGAWIGTALLGDWGPQLGGLALVNGIIGAFFFAFVVRLLLGSATGGECESAGA